MIKFEPDDIDWVAGEFMQLMADATDAEVWMADYNPVMYLAIVEFCDEMHRTCWNRKVSSPDGEQAFPDFIVLPEPLSLRERWERFRRGFQ